MAAELSVVEFEAVREASVKVRLLLLHVHEGLTQLIQCTYRYYIIFIYYKKSNDNSNRP